MQLEDRDKAMLMLGAWIGAGISWLANVVLPGTAGSGLFP